MNFERNNGLAVAAALAAASILSACAKPEAGSGGAGAGSPAVDNSAPLPGNKLVAARTTVDLSKSDPTADYWNAVAGGSVTLMGQPMINPKPESTTTDSVQVQALHDGTQVAFRLRWKDTEVSEAGRLGEFSDAVALEFPYKTGSQPPVMMGAVGMPVQLYHWRAQYQHDEEKGKPTLAQLYPNASVDMYALEVKDDPTGMQNAAERYQPAKAVGNPQSYPKRAVDVLLAEGFGSTAVQNNDGATARGVWADGAWTVVITRPLASPTGSILTPGAPANIAFAVWQGGKNEVGSRKCLTMMWTDLQLQ